MAFLWGVISLGQVFINKTHMSFANTLRFFNLFS